MPFYFFWHKWRRLYCKGKMEVQTPHRTWSSSLEYLTQHSAVATTLGCRWERERERENRGMLTLVKRVDSGRHSPRNQNPWLGLRHVHKFFKKKIWVSHDVEMSYDRERTNINWMSQLSSTKKWTGPTLAEQKKFCTSGRYKIPS